MPEKTGHSHNLEDLPPVRENAVAEYLQKESAIYLEAGEFYFRNPQDLGMRLLVNWFNEVAQSPPERRWATLEMLAMYGLSAVDSVGGMDLTEQHYLDLVSALATEGPLKEDLEHVANDVLSLLQSGADPAAELPEQWGFYRHVLPVTYTSACLLFAVLTLEVVRGAAVEDQVHPADMWVGWLTSTDD